MSRSLIAAAVAAPALLATVLAGPAAAAPHRPAAAPRAAQPIPHPERDYAGSTIPAHEGGHRSARVPAEPRVAQTPGMDVSSHQGSVNWSAAWKNGGKFAYVKATEGTTYKSPDFTQQYNGSYNAGMIRGAYHFALPNTSGGAAQANWFVAHGGGWSKDGKTLPPALDIEYNPYGSSCYGLSQSAMVNWIADFSNTVHAKTGRYPTIYTTTNWWKTCTGNNGSFGATNPLWLARYASSPGTLPAGWGFHTIWQYADSGTFPGDQDRFNGSYDRLKALANG